MKWLLLLLLTSCQSVPTRAIINACVAEQIDLCGDLICEGDETFEKVIKAAHDAINYCLDYPDSISNEYYDKNFQLEIFSRYNK